MVSYLFLCFPGPFAHRWFFKSCHLFILIIISFCLYDHSLFSFCFDLIFIFGSILLLFFPLFCWLLLQPRFRNLVALGRFDFQQITRLNFRNLNLRFQRRKDHILDTLLGHSLKFTFYFTNNLCKLQIHIFYNDVCL